MSKRLLLSINRCIVRQIVLFSSSVYLILEPWSRSRVFQEPIGTAALASDLSPEYNGQSNR